MACRLEKNRLGTFNGRWPPNSCMRPQELAKAGFYYVGVADVVRCIFCQISLKAWEPGDVPMEEHRKHSPSCPFVLQQNIGNVPLPLPNSHVQSPSETFPLEWRNVSFNWRLVLLKITVVVIIEDSEMCVEIFSWFV